MNSAGTIKALTNSGAIMAGLKPEYWAVEGVIYILVVRGGNLLVLFTSLHATGSSNPMVGGEAAEAFITQTIGCALKPGDMKSLMGNQSKGIKAKISIDQYRRHFPK
jgi:hypothetical protein